MTPCGKEVPGSYFLWLEGAKRVTRIGSASMTLGTTSACGLVPVISCCSCVMAAPGPLKLITMILKPSKSGKALVVIDDFGNVYSVPLSYLLALLGGRVPNGPGFALASRMTQPANLDRFQPSPIFLGLDGDGKALTAEEGDDSWTPPQCPHLVAEVRNHGDGLSDQAAGARAEKRMFTDKVIEWD